MLSSSVLKIVESGLSADIKREWIYRSFHLIKNKKYYIFITVNSNYYLYLISTSGLLI